MQASTRALTRTPCLAHWRLSWTEELSVQLTRMKQSKETQQEAAQIRVCGWQSIRMSSAVSQGQILFPASLRLQRVSSHPDWLGGKRSLSHLCNQSTHRKLASLSQTTSSVGTSVLESGQESVWSAILVPNHAGNWRRTQRLNEVILRWTRKPAVMKVNCVTTVTDDSCCALRLQSQTQRTLFLIFHLHLFPSLCSVRIKLYK